MTMQLLALANRICKRRLPEFSSRRAHMLAPLCTGRTDAALHTVDA
jgi:hypothetical protein